MTAPAAVEVTDSDGDALLDAPDGASASAGAKAEKQRVEDLSQRTESSSVFANPDGTFTRRDFGATVRVKKSGDWVPVDYTLVEQEDGSYAPKASDVDITIGGSGAREAAHVALDGDETLAFTWPRDLPAPSVDGGVATYKLSKATDLVVAVTATGVTARIRLNEEPAADDPVFTLGLRANDLDLEQKSATGALEITDQDGKTVGSAQQLLAWDSQTDRAGDPSNVVELDANLEQTSTAGDGTNHVLELTAPDGFLSDPDTDYPVTIDPNIRVGRVRDTWVRSGQANAYGDDFRLVVGKVDPDTSSNTNPARALMKFFDSRVDTNPNVKVTNATLSLWQYYGYSCTDRRMLTYPVGAPWSDNLTWASGLPAMKWTNGTYVDDNRGAAGCGQGWTKLNITSMAQAWNSGAIDNNGLRIQADDETLSAFERRFCSMDPISSESICNTATRSPTLDVTYNTRPSTPAAPVVTATGNTVAISAKVADPDGHPVRAHFIVDLDGETVYDGYSTYIESGGTATKTLTGMMEGSYSVRVEAHDGSWVSAPSPERTVEVNPVISSVEGRIAPVTTMHLVDTRTGLGGSSAAYAPNEVREYQVSGTGSIPSDASAVVLGITASPTTATDIRIGVADQSIPVNPTLTAGPQRPRTSTTTIARVSADGRLRVKNGLGTTHVALDVRGYLRTGNSDHFIEVEPADLFAGTVGDEVRASPGDEHGVPNDATGLWVEVRTSEAKAVGSLTLGSSASNGGGSSIEYWTQAPHESVMLMPFNPADGFVIKNSNPAAAPKVQVRVIGYLTPADETTAMYHAVEPSPIYRTGPGGLAALAPGETRDVYMFDVAGISGDGDVSAVAATVRASGWGSPGSLLVQNPDLEAADGATISFSAADAPVNGVTSTVIVEPGVDGYISVKNTSSKPVHITLDSQGWFGVPVATDVEPSTEGAAVETSQDPVVQDILELQPGTTEAEVLETATEIAASSESSEAAASDVAAEEPSADALSAVTDEAVEEVTAEMLEEAQSAAERTIALGDQTAPGDDAEEQEVGVAETPLGESSSAKRQVSIMSSSNSDGKWRLSRKARRAGDVVYNPSKTAAIRHGHSALFTGQWTLVEAPGMKKRARTVDFKRKRWNVMKGSVLQEVKKDGKLFSGKVRSRVIKWAKSRAGDGKKTGDLYNYSFFNNAQIVSGRVGAKNSRQNCSQLVWAAWRRQGLNLNNTSRTGRLGIYPSEIVDSKYTVTYDRIDSERDAGDGF